MIGIGYRPSLANVMLFDDRKIRRMMNTKTRKAFGRFGSYTRTTARRSMRKRKAASAPGSPPSVHEGQIKRFLLYSYDVLVKSVVIGPTLLGRSPTTLELMEFGGVRRRRMGERRRHTRGRKRGQFAKREVIKTHATYPARPFMGPAFEIAKEKLPEFWSR